MKDLSKSKQLLCIVAAIFCGAYGLQAQNGIGLFGNTKIHSGSELHASNYTLHNIGVTETERTEPIGTLSLSGVSNGSDEPTGYTDGYMRNYSSGAFEFQTGQSDIYAPIKIEIGQENSLDVAYNHSSYYPESVGESLEAVSETEYWDVLGENSGKLTLTWQPDSNLDDFLENISEIIIAGWNGSEWTAIASTVQEGSDLENGSITSNATEDFSVYSAFTFGKTDELGTLDIEFLNVAITLQKGFLYIHSDKEIEKAEIWDVSGRFLRSYDQIQTFRYQADFSYPKGVYIAKVYLKNGKIITKKLMHK